MANIRIKNLTSTTSVADSDSIAIDGSSSNTRKFSFSSLWSWIMNKTYAFTQGTKSIPNAINSLFSGSFLDDMSNYTSISSGDLDNYYTPGTYTVMTSSAASNIDNMPCSTGGRLEIISVLYSESTQSSARRLMQIYYANGTAGNIFIRSWSGSSWGTWGKIAKQADIDTLTSAIEVHTLTVNSNLNTISEDGVYISASSAITNNITGSPFTGAGFVMQMYSHSNTGKIQIVFKGGNTAGMIYTRTSTSSGWSSWYSYSGTIVS